MLNKKPFQDDRVSSGHLHYEFLIRELSPFSGTVHSNDYTHLLLFNREVLIIAVHCTVALMGIQHHTGNIIS